MSEYILSDLPRYVKTKNRSELNNSPVADGHALLFSEDGTNLVAKLPDGSFSEVGASGSGIDTSDATASASDILSGKTAYVNGEKITGNIANVSASQDGNVVTVPKGYVAAAQTLTIGTAKAAQIYTPGASNQIISSGQYLTGDQTIAGDENLLAGNIKEGVSIFNVAGSLAASASCDFYKCASVDTEAKTWTGYKAVLTDGVYSFEATATTGLTFSSVTPVVGKIYSVDTLVNAVLYTGITTDGLVCYVSFNDNYITAETEQSITPQGTVVHEIDNGVPCVNFGGTGSLWIEASFFPTGANPWTLSAFLKKNSAGAVDDNGAWFGYYPELERSIWSGISYDQSKKIHVGTHGPYGWMMDLSDVDIPVASWFHLALAFDGTSLKIYKNGTFISSKMNTFDTASTTMAALGSFGARSSDPYMDGKMSSFRCYNRALTQSEIAGLAAERSWN